MTEIRDKTENLIPFVAGVSGNPNGRPKGTRNRSTIVREMLEMLHESGKPNVEVMTAAVIEKATKGDVQAWEKLLDSGFGKVVDKIVEVKPNTQDEDFTKEVLESLPTEQLEALLAKRTQDNPK